MGLRTISYNLHVRWTASRQPSPKSRPTAQTFNMPKFFVDTVGSGVLAGNPDPHLEFCKAVLWQCSIVKTFYTSKTTRELNRLPFCAKVKPNYWTTQNKIVGFYKSNNKKEIYLPNICMQEALTPSTNLPQLPVGTSAIYPFLYNDWVRMTIN